MGRDYGCYTESVNPLMPGGNKRSCVLKAAGLFKFKPPDI